MTFDPSFKIFIAYENFTVAIKAKETLERVAVQVEPEYDAWPFELLGMGRVREYAINRAAAANMIVVAARSGVELPAPVRSWIERGLCGRGSDPVALVAVLEGGCMQSGNPPRVCTYLREIAERKKVDFFCNWSTGSGEGVRRSSHRFPEFDSRVAGAGASEWSA